MVTHIIGHEPPQDTNFKQSCSFFLRFLWDDVGAIENNNTTTTTPPRGVIIIIVHNSNHRNKQANFDFPKGVMLANALSLLGFAIHNSLNANSTASVCPLDCWLCEVLKEKLPQATNSLRKFIK